MFMIVLSFNEASIYTAYSDVVGTKSTAYSYVIGSNITKSTAYFYVIGCNITKSTAYS